MIRKDGEPDEDGARYCKWTPVDLGAYEKSRETSIFGLTVP